MRLLIHHNEAPGHRPKGMSRPLLTVVLSPLLVMLKVPDAVEE
jgi:hypothetical protein